MNSWPTFVLIGPNGKVLAQISGEGHRKVLHISLENATVVVHFVTFASFDLANNSFWNSFFLKESMRTILSRFISKTGRTPRRLPASGLQPVDGHDQATLSSLWAVAVHLVHDGRESGRERR